MPRMPARGSFSTSTSTLCSSTPSSASASSIASSTVLPVVSTVVLPLASTSGISFPSRGLASGPCGDRHPFSIDIRLACVVGGAIVTRTFRRCARLRRFPRRRGLHLRRRCARWTDREHILPVDLAAHVEVLQDDTRDVRDCPVQGQPRRYRQTPEAEHQRHHPRHHLRLLR